LLTPSRSSSTKRASPWRKSSRNTIRTDASFKDKVTVEGGKKMWTLLEGGKSKAAAA
jgi:hypothetical protein